MNSRRHLTRREDSILHRKESLPQDPGGGPSAPATGFTCGHCLASPALKGFRSPPLRCVQEFGAIYSLLSAFSSDPTGRWHHSRPAGSPSCSEGDLKGKTTNERQRSPGTQLAWPWAGVSTRHRDTGLVISMASETVPRGRDKELTCGLERPHCRGECSQHSRIEV